MAWFASFTNSPPIRTRWLECHEWFSPGGDARALMDVPPNDSFGRERRERVFSTCLVRRRVLRFAPTRQLL